LRKSVSVSLIIVLILVNPFIGGQKAESKLDDLRLQKAVDYIVNRYDNRMGLVSESEDTGSMVPDGTPCNRTFWIYSDNLLASRALEPFNSAIAENISSTIAPYLMKVGKPNLFEVVLGEKITSTMYDGSDIIVDHFSVNGENYTVWVDRHQSGDGGVFYDAGEYADLCFYLALNCCLNGDFENATRLLKIGEGMWDGRGFFDKAVNANGTYQNYKLGLYLFAVKALGYNSSIYDSVESTAWSYQKDNGGVASQSYLNGSIYGTANVETTSALLLAYNEELMNSFRSLWNQSITSTTTITATSTITVTTATTTTETMTAMSVEYLLEGVILVAAVGAIAFMIVFCLRRGK
jgi:hypothetical protein